MPVKRRKFQRSLGERRYRKLFVIATEGEKTEPQYFAIFNDHESVIQVRCLKSTGHDSSPASVLKRMNNYLSQADLRPSDEAWLVVDTDQWTNKQLDQLDAWAQKCRNYGLAVSNPNFEYWLLLHFEDGGGIASSRNCTERLKRHLPQYEKQICASNFTRGRIRDAIHRARQRDSPSCSNYPSAIFGSTVYKLVGNIRRDLDAQ
jgi:hypothetical protein